ncbi:type III-A CRISPR-associated RAMP protein Csm4 [uncultured Microscilla sp.]|uniref:type III-A CRISPR-associated RAMP protein Csm4 n=1 Tax=uncultured Microscilla sp. TaxID=432653 RepID=UPI0026298382|nr:type III-A CRISPR-associated RAMP protein Csm4 [uncultured Microscilla sp.]
MQAVILKCTPNAQFHFGQLAIDENTSLDDTSEYLHSDTLFSAIINIAARVYPQQTDDLVQHFETGNLGVSSGFYCLETAPGQYVYFLPKPLSCQAFRLGNENQDKFKKLKKVKYVSKKVWEEGITPDRWQTECVFLQKKFVLHPSELPEDLRAEAPEIRIFDKESLPKVKVHTAVQEDNLYMQTNIQIQDNEQLNLTPKVHFYFLLKTDSPDADYHKQLKTILRFLADAGIGGERSAGLGQLESIEFQDFALQVTTPNAWSNLSLTIPQSENEAARLKYYELVSRGGRATGRKLKDGTLEKLLGVRMVKEGAVLQEPIAGHTVSIAPKNTPYPYLRYGQCFALQLHSNFSL